MAETTTSNLHAPTDKALKVSFPSGDGYVVGHLYLPNDYDQSRRYPAVAVGGSLTSVKEMMGGIYAGEMAKRGVMALVIDYRNYGESSGARRQYEDQASKAEDLRAALAFLKARQDVSNTGLLGICTSGGTVMYAAANNADVGAVAAVAGAFSEPSLAVQLRGAEAVESLKAKGRAAFRHYEETGEIETILAYHPTDTSAANVSPSEYYFDQDRGGSVGPWRNAFAVMTWEAWLDFDPVTQAAQVTAPALVIHSDGAAFPDQARKVYDRLAGCKELYWPEGKKHFDFYDQNATVSDAADRLAAHFRNALA